MAKSVGARLRTARTLRGLTQTTVARRLGTDPNVISEIEKGRHAKAYERLAAFAVLYQISADTLLGLRAVVKEHRTLEKL